MKDDIDCNRMGSRFVHDLFQSVRDERKCQIELTQLETEKQKKLEVYRRIEEKLKKEQDKTERLEHVKKEVEQKAREEAAKKEDFQELLKATKEQMGMSTGLTTATSSQQNAELEGEP